MEDDIKDELEKIKSNETGKSIGIISTITLICGAITLIAFLIYGFINFENSPADIVLCAILGVISMIVSYIFSTILSMFQEMHYVIVHLDDLIKKDNTSFHCKVCGKEIPYNENGTCEECHNKIMNRIREKN